MAQSPYVTDEFRKNDFAERHLTERVLVSLEDVDQSVPIQFCAFDDEMAQVGGVRGQVCNTLDKQRGESGSVPLSVVLDLPKRESSCV